MGAMGLKSPASPLVTRPFIQAQIIENIKAPHHWPLCGEFTGYRWIRRTNGQWRGKCFHLMTSSWSSWIRNQHLNVFCGMWLFTSLRYLLLSHPWDVNFVVYTFPELCIWLALCCVSVVVLPSWTIFHIYLKLILLHSFYWCTSWWPGVFYRQR